VRGGVMLGGTGRVRASFFSNAAFREPWRWTARTAAPGSAVADERDAVTRGGGILVEVSTGARASSALSVYALLLVAIAPGAGACRKHEQSASLPLVPSPPSAHATTEAATSASAPTPVPAAPADPVTGAVVSDEECERLWQRFRAAVPESPHVHHEDLVARCRRSERDVLDCVLTARRRAEEELPRSDAGHDPIRDRWRVAEVAKQFGVCVTGQRLRFAERAGELERLAREVAKDRAGDGPDGARIVAGTDRTLAWHGALERDEHGAPLPSVEVRVARPRDGSVLLYFLGSCCARDPHQDGFVYANGPVASSGAIIMREYLSSGRPERRICLGTVPGDAGRLLHDCFEVLQDLSPQLIATGWRDPT
jgi:hypothetical protein